MYKCVCAIPRTVRSGRRRRRHVCYVRGEKKCAVTMARFIAHVYTRNIPHFYPETDKSKSYCTYVDFRYISYPYMEKFHPGSQ